MKKTVRRTHRVLFVGKADEKVEAVLAALSPRDYDIELTRIDDPKTIVSAFTEIEPAAILMSVEAENINALMNVKGSAILSHVPIIAFSHEEGAALERIAEELDLYELIVLKTQPGRDAKRIEKLLTEKLQFSAIKDVPEVMSHFVSRYSWYDPAAEPGDYWDELSFLLEKLGVRKSLAGHKYLIAAITLQTARVFIQPKELYETVADCYDTTPLAVEKAIRYAIESAWTRGDIYAQHFYFGLSIDEDRGKPTNAEFIARLAIELRNR